MLALSADLKALLLPPGALILLGGFGLLLVVFRRRRVGWTFFGLSLVTAVALSLPMIAWHGARSLQVYPSLPPDVTQLDAEAIVVLSGDFRADLPEYGLDVPGPLSLERCRYGAYLARRTGLPLLVAGGVLRPDRPAVSVRFAHYIEHELGVPVRWTEERSRTTRENALFTAELLRAADIQRVALVTHAWHMPRAYAAFERAGLEVLAAPTADASPPRGWQQGLVPRAEAFLLSVRVLHEWVGRVWYAAQG
jgi:uncharacterized SAM-binding protein YcdF (DUF218 family)